ncbi:peptide chain release factor N(5)-glutamine methyltransferase [Desulfogranum japonicum]|uniref:peptide chain release factor N(5)-glutamine methyltransferase n=1 Tax=Desulfogranum japonicum TaxID=231447 RepID=UPI0005517CC4|nr:peptide chain release factor N(5)-glutamine methyltransferase [Desulfogranum japonicum]
MRISELLIQASAKLHGCGVSAASLEAELIMLHVLGCSRAKLYLSSDDNLTPDQQEKFSNLIAHRCRRIPLQHLTGQREFWSLDFIVGPDVLIPRPETEFLLECVLQSVHRTACANALDLCTGSGVIATILALELETRVLATDLSLPALAVARQNVAHHECTDKISLLCCDLFSAIAPKKQFDLIVSNPPYVGLNEQDQLEPEVKDHEPHLALFSGEDGMDSIIRILTSAPQYLRSGGSLFLEIGAGQSESVLSLASHIGHYRKTSITQDWSGKDRVFHGRL